jgi:ABC-2 type transport system ATP-binding protein
MSYLEFQSISKMYDKNTVLSDVSFQVSKGEVFGIFGPNGSGKTTLLKILCGLTQANSGKITLENQVLRADSINYKKFIGAVFVDVQPFENVTCLDLLVFFGKFYGKNDSEIKTKLNELKKTFQMQ